MHLLVLGAFGPSTPPMSPTPPRSLNAPSGAGCFLTHSDNVMIDVVKTCLNAPSGAGCFLTQGKLLQDQLKGNVLMHLLVLGAF